MRTAIEIAGEMAATIALLAELDLSEESSTRVYVKAMALAWVLDPALDRQASYQAVKIMIEACKEMRNA